MHTFPYKKKWDESWVNFPKDNSETWLELLQRYVGFKLLAP